MFTDRSTQSVTTQTINIVMIDTSKAFLESLPLALHRFGFLKVIARATTIAEGLQQMRESAPDIALINGHLFQQGFRALSDLVPIRMGECQLAVFANGLSDAQLEIASSNRVHGFLSTQDSTNEIAELLEQLAANQIAISKHLAERISVGRDKQIVILGRNKLNQLSDRQLEVLSHLASGLRVKDIADRMGLSAKAVESHKFRIMSRLNIRDRVMLCRWAIREGLIEP